MLSSCEPVYKETITTRQENYPPEFRISASDFKKELLQTVPGEDVFWSSSVTQVNGGKETHSLNIKILNPEEFSNPVVFFFQAGAVKDQAGRLIENFDDYDKISISFEEKSLKNGSEITRTQKREIDL